MPWYKCNKCGEDVFVPKKLEHGKKRSVRCSNPRCGAWAPLKVRNNGNVRGLRCAFA